MCGLPHANEVLACFSFFEVCRSGTQYMAATIIYMVTVRLIHFQAFTPRLISLSPFPPPLFPQRTLPTKLSSRSKVSLSS